MVIPVINPAPFVSWFVFVGIVGLLLRSLYEPDVATVANVGLPVTPDQATLVAVAAFPVHDPALSAYPALLTLTALIVASL